MSVSRISLPLWRHAIAGGIYAALSYALLCHGAGLTDHILGIGSDPYLFIWHLAWWPWALMNHINLQHTALVWQPEGLDIAWTTSVPLLALLATPVTLLLSPVFSLNLLTLLAPVCNGLAAYWLCLNLTRNFWAAFLGGLLYSFSGYFMGEALEDLNLQFGFAEPLLLWLFISRIHNQITRTSAILGGALLLAAQFYISIELFAGLVLFGALGLMMSVTLLPSYRRRLYSLLLELGFAAMLTLLLISPQLIPMLVKGGDFDMPPIWPIAAAAHLGNLILPSPETLLVNPRMQPLSRGLLGLLPANDAAAGLPIVLILFGAAYSMRNKATVRLACWMLFLILFASLGPKLWYGNLLLNTALPWALVVKLPLLKDIWPVRFAAYTSLLIAILAACWCAQPVRWQKARYGLVVAAVLFMLPPPHPVRGLPRIDFFQPNQIRAALGPHPKLEILPLRDGRDPAPYWQVQSGFAFESTTGYSRLPPRSVERDPAIQYLSFGHVSAQTAGELKAFYLRTGTQYVVAVPGTDWQALALIKQIGWPCSHIDDVVLFKVQP